MGAGADQWGVFRSLLGFCSSVGTPHSNVAHFKFPRTSRTKRRAPSTMLPNKRLKLHVDTTTTTNTTDATACVDISWFCVSRFLPVHSLSCLALSSKRMAKLFAEELNRLLRLKRVRTKLLLKRVLKLKGVVRFKVGGFLTLHTLTQLYRSNKRLASIFGIDCWKYAGYANEAERTWAKYSAPCEALMRCHLPPPFERDQNEDIDSGEESDPDVYHLANWRFPEY